MAITKGKNYIKYESYKYAFQRMQDAINHKFFLEAIPIAESIISDRILSYLMRRQQVDDSSQILPKKRNNFSALIQSWKTIDGQVTFKEIPDLIDAVDEWRQSRNECTHQIAKSSPGEPTKPIEEFIDLSHNCAIHGYELAKNVVNWTNLEKTKLEKIIHIKGCLKDKFNQESLILTREISQIRNVRLLTQIQKALEITQTIEDLRKIYQ